MSFKLNLFVLISPEYMTSLLLSGFFSRLPLETGSYNKVSFL